MNIDFISFNLHNLTKVPITVYENGVLILSFENLNIPKRVENIISSNINSVFTHINPSNISRLTDVSELSYFGFELSNYKIIFGPFLIQELSNQAINNLKQRLRIIGEDSVLVDHMYNSLKLITVSEIQLVYSMYFSVFGRKQDRPKFMSIVPENVKISQEDVLNSLFTELEYVTKNYIIEDQFTTIIEQGDVEKALSFVSERIMMSLPKRALNDTLRNNKTRLTILNTISNRAAIRGGIDVQLGHQISTNYGIKIESMKSVFDNEKITKEIIVSYAEAVRDYSLSGYSKLVRQAILNIRRNITTNNNLEHLATSLFVSKEHLARRFKKETSDTVSTYIKKAKIIEAKKLLESTTQSIVNITTMLGFSNSSHFSKVFKDLTGTSPHKYRINKTPYTDI